MNERYLPSALRRALERVIKEARIAAEEGAKDAIRRLGVADSKAPEYLSDAEKELRRRLRAHARALGDAFDRSNDTQETKHLNEAAGYAHWHRMLFARFLAERGLLRNPEYDVPVTLEDCRELAEAEGLTDPWAIAERYSAQMLPAVFRIDDPVLALEIDTVQTQKLQKLVTGLDAEVFQAEDSLGWSYQFWRAAEKDTINKSGVKIGADELPAVTQLFTEPYMVQFLLHNTLGAWWAGKVLAANPALAQSAEDEEALRAACSLPEYGFDMLRFVRKGKDGPWRPAAGTFPGWPKEAKNITMLDPCCGSGHFLTEALAILAALRQAEEHLLPGNAVAAVLRDNLHGLEIDGRCVQIAAFAVALSAWRIGGWQTLPVPQIAWVGAPPPLPKREFVALADGDTELEYALAALHDLFAQAPVLGTLLEPSGGDLFEAERLKEIERLLEPLLERARRAEPENVEGVVAARGMADAAQLLHRHYTVQATNVPFLGSSRQNSVLSQFIERRYQEAKADLATAMIMRMAKLAETGGTWATVSPQTWLFLRNYRDFRNQILTRSDLLCVAALGPRAFETITGEVVNTSLTIISKQQNGNKKEFLAIDANVGKDAKEKSEIIRAGDATIVSQAEQLKNPDSTITLSAASLLPRLSKYATSWQGLVTGDTQRFVAYFWEIASSSENWEYFISSPNSTEHYVGRDKVVQWDKGNGSLHNNSGAHNFPPATVLGKKGILLSQGKTARATLYTGEVFNDGSVPIIPNSPDDLGAIYAFLSDVGYTQEVRKINQKLIMGCGYFIKVPFDREYWAKEYGKQYPNGLPLPSSDEPRQWLFHGHPRNATKGAALHVALARMSGFRWPAETDSHMCLSDEASALVSQAGALPSGDNDGLLGVPPVAGEKSLADRLRAYLADAFGTDWSDALERRLIAEADEVLDKKVARDGSLEAWVRDRAFSQHCALFEQRPFLWHISDGLKDGFSVFVHYHRFDQANLRKLTYTLLGDWLARAKAEGNSLRYEKGRELQQTLEKILEGEKPYDIFVRWKSLSQQPLGWDPDLDDGVRQNIRPFIKAGVLTHKLDKILKDKDRGKDVTSAPWFDVFNGERRNDHYTTLAEKRAARGADT
jgi:hypothetical protein